MYFGWGPLVALTSVFAAQRLERRFGLVLVLAVTLSGVALDLLAGGILHDSVAGLVAVVVVSGALLGIVKTVLTFVAGKLGEHVSAPAPMYLGAGMVVALSCSRSSSRATTTASRRP